MRAGVVEITDLLCLLPPAVLVTSVSVVLRPERLERYRLADSRMLALYLPYAALVLLAQILAVSGVLAVEPPAGRFWYADARRRGHHRDL